MRILARAAIAAVLLPACAHAQSVTIETTLGERGFGDGIVLQGQQSSSVFVALPRGPKLTNGRLVIDGQSTTPTLQRGSFFTEVNGRPADAIGLSGKSGPTALQRTIPLGDDRLNGVDALNIRFGTDLRTTTDPCRDEFDPANSVTISPASRLFYDIDIGKVRSIGDALALLPHRPLVQLPAQPKISPEVAAAALSVGVLLTSRGMEPRFEAARGEDAIAVRLEAFRDRSPESPSIKIERNGGKIDIVIDPSADFVALTRILQTAPGVLAGEQAALSAPPRAQQVDERFREFGVLPPAQRINRFGEWRLNFPLVANNGRMMESALLKMFISPDWSGERPILTAYLNDQIVAAARPEPGQADFSVALPVALLRFTNTLRVTLERAGGDRYCASADLGQAAQILPGSGLVLGDSKGTGFIRVANAFGREGQVIFPPRASEAAAIGPYLGLASRTLTSLGGHARKLSVSFDAAASSGAGGTLRFDVVGAGGLIVSMADQVGGARPSL